MIVFFKHSSDYVRCGEKQAVLLRIGLPAQSLLLPLLIDR
jgi:hypothetical protein